LYQNDTIFVKFYFTVSFLPKRKKADSCCRLFCSNFNDLKQKTSIFTLGTVFAFKFVSMRRSGTTRRKGDATLAVPVL